METKQSHTPCPECGTPCTIQWSGLDLVENTGDETLASKLYVPVSAPSLLEENKKLKEFKRYVHDRLDKMGIPENPDPIGNASHGCRIEGRLDVITLALKERDTLKEEVEQLKWQLENADSRADQALDRAKEFKEELDQAKSMLKYNQDAALSLKEENEKMRSNWLNERNGFIETHNHEVSKLQSLNREL